MASKQMILLTILCALSSQMAFGDVYKCTKNGTSTYSGMRFHPNLMIYL